MANMTVVNKAIKTKFPTLDIQVIRGDGYIYFDGKDGFDKIDSTYVNPVSTSTETVIKLVIQDIEHYLK